MADWILLCTHIQHHMAEQRHSVYQSHYSTFLQGMGYTASCWRCHPHYGRCRMGRAQDRNHWGRNVQAGRHHSKIRIGSSNNLGSCWQEGLLLVLETLIALCSSVHRSSYRMADSSLPFHRTFLVDNLYSFQLPPNLICHCRYLKVKKI